MANTIFALGEPATSDSFIGREVLVSSLRKIVFNDDKYRRVSITGLPRIGKTSLVKNALDIDSIRERGYLYIFMQCDGIRGDVDFWQTMVLTIKNELTACGGAPAQDYMLLSLIADFLHITTYGAKLAITLREIFNSLKKHGKTVLLVIDEFDSVRSLFADESANFGLLRSITSQYGFYIKTVLISRRTIRSITMAAEKNMPANSTLSGVFTERITVKGFDNDDMERYYDVFKRHGAALPGVLKKDMGYYCGRNPFLLSLFGDKILTGGNSTTADVIFKKLFGIIIEYYNSVIALFKEDETLQKLFECVIGPSVTITKYDVAGLQEIGAIEPTKSAYTAITDCFADYAKTLSISFQAWALLESTQKALQGIVKTALPSGYESDPSEHSKLLKHVRANKRDFGFTSDVADVAPLRYTVKIITDNWPLFKRFFNNEGLESWKDKLEFCARIRNPIGHVQNDFLSDEDKNRFNIYCKQILDAVGRA